MQDTTTLDALEAHDTHAIAAVREDRAEWRDEAPVLDDVAYEPTEEEEQDYRLWCAEREARLLEDCMYRDAMDDEDDARLAAAVYQAVKVGDYQGMLAALANAFTDHHRADARAVGCWIGEKYDEARSVDATSAEQHEDRRDCMIDARAMGDR